MNKQSTADTLFHNELTSVTSGITDRVIGLNLDAHRFWLPDEFSAPTLGLVESDWKQYFERIRQAVETGAKRMPLTVAAAIDRLWIATSLDEYKLAITPLAQIVLGLSPRRHGGFKRTMEPLVLLAKHGLLAFPAGKILLNDEAQFWYRGMPALDEEFFGQRASLFNLLRPVSHAGTNIGSFVRLILATQDVVELGDIDSAALSLLRPFAESYRDAYKRGQGPRQQRTNVRVDSPHDALRAVSRRLEVPKPARLLCDSLHLAQRHLYRDDERRLARISSVGYKEILLPSALGRSDPTFEWAREARTAKDRLYRMPDQNRIRVPVTFDLQTALRLRPWADACADYMSTLTGVVNGETHIDALNSLLDFVIRVDSTPDNLRDFLHEDCQEAKAFARQLGPETVSPVVYRSKLSTLHRFFSWALMKYASDDRGYALSGFRLPIGPDDIPRGATQGQTYRTAIPLRFLRLMRDILESCDRDGTPTYSWARNFGADHFKWIDPVTDKPDWIWSPVRTFYFLLRLSLPLRGFQVRALDSGEGDEFAFRPDDPAGPWVPNTSRHRKPDHTAGFIRRLYDSSTATHLNGMYVNTNKTADRRADWSETGYEIPWQDDEMLRLFVTLRDFQEKYNPLIRPQTIAEVQTLSRFNATRDVKKRLRPIHFLFRDPSAVRFPQEPVSSSRVKTMWLALCEEVEARLEKAGIRGDDGQKIVLIVKRGERGRPQGSVFDMHSLRVSGLTHFVHAKVPIQVLSAFVAGHASYLMTYYYVRPTPHEVDEILRQGQQTLRREEVEARDFAAWIKDKPLQALEEALSVNDKDVYELLQSLQSGFWGAIDYGFCPAGFTKCDEGGPATHQVGGQVWYAPVPGGPQNCACCRFFVTGPAWLGGLAAKFNEKMGELYEALTELKSLEKSRKELLGSMDITDSLDPRLWHDRAVRKVDAAIEAKEGEITVVAETLGRLDLHIEIVKAIAKKREEVNATSPALVVAGSVVDLEIALQNTTLHDLWYRILEGADLYPGVNTKVPVLRLSKLYDALLSRDKLPAYFVSLSDGDLERSVLDFARLLRTRVGDETANELAEGRKLLSDVGLTNDVSAFLARASVKAAEVLANAPPLVQLSRRSLLSQPC